MAEPLTNQQQLLDAIISILTRNPEECFRHLVESRSHRIEAILREKGVQAKSRCNVPGECIEK